CCAEPADHDEIWLEQHTIGVYEVKLAGAAQKTHSTILVGIASQSDGQQTARRSLRLPDWNGSVSWGLYFGVARLHADAIGDAALERGCKLGQVRRDVTARLSVGAGRLQDDFQAAKVIPTLLEGLLPTAPHAAGA